MCSEGCVRENEKSLVKALFKVLSITLIRKAHKNMYRESILLCFIKKRERGKIQDQKYELKKLKKIVFLNYSVEWEKFTEI